MFAENSDPPPGRAQRVTCDKVSEILTDAEGTKAVE